MSKKKKEAAAVPAGTQNAQPTDGKQRANKKSHAGFIGFLFILAGIAALLCGFYFWRMTWGTRLLFTRASIGRISKYWEIMAGGGALLVIIGALILRFRKKKKPSKEPEQEAPVPEAKPKPEPAKPAAEVKPKPEPAKPAAEVKTEPEPAEPAAEATPEPETPEPAAEVTPEPESPKPAKEEAKTETPSTPAIPICPRCGNTNKPGAKFCAYCGSKL